VPRPGSMIKSSAFVTGAIILGFQPGPVLAVNALGIFVLLRLKAPATYISLITPTISC